MPGTSRSSGVSVLNRSARSREHVKRLEHVMHVPNFVLGAVVFACTLLALLSGGFLYVSIQAEPALLSTSSSLDSLGKTMDEVMQLMNNMHSNLVGLTGHLQQVTPPVNNIDKEVQTSLSLLKSSESALEDLSSATGKAVNSIDYLVINAYALCKASHPVKQSSICHNLTAVAERLAMQGRKPRSSLRPQPFEMEQREAWPSDLKKLPTKAAMLQQGQEKVMTFQQFSREDEDSIPINHQPDDVSHTLVTKNGN